MAENQPDTNGSEQAPENEQRIISPRRLDIRAAARLVGHPIASLIAAVMNTSEPIVVRDINNPDDTGDQAQELTQQPKRRASRKKNQS